MAGSLVEFISVLKCGPDRPSNTGLEKFTKALKVDAQELSTFATKT
jgi:hypothetical protein